MRSFSQRFLREMPRISAASVRLPSAWASARCRYSRSNSFSAAPSGRGSGCAGAQDYVARARDVAGQVLDVDVGCRPPAPPRAGWRARAGGRCRGTANCASAVQAAWETRGVDFACLLPELLEEELHQQRQVALALAQRRDVDVEDVEAVVEVLAEQARRDHALLQVAVGRGDDAHVDAHRLVGAQRLDHPLLQHAQQLGLRGHRHLGDLVEQQRAAVRGAEAAVALLDRAREGAALVTEQLRLQQRLGERRAVDRDERPCRAGRRGRAARARPAPCRCRSRPAAAPARGWCAMVLTRSSRRSICTERPTMTSLMPSFASSRARVSSSRSSARCSAMRCTRSVISSISNGLVR